MKISSPASLGEGAGLVRRYRAIAILLSIFFCASVAGAQTGGVRGRVILAGVGAPVNGAIVSVVGTARAASSTEDGSFSFTGLTPGNYEIEGRRLGTAVARVSVTVREEEMADVTLRVADAPVEIVGVEVVGSRADALARLPGSGAVISAQELHALQPLSANEALRTIPGVNVQEEEGVGLRANVGVRGLDPDRSRTLLVLEDGVPVALAPYGEPEMYYSPPIDRMNRVELVKGSGSILFGPQTIGGVLNYVTAEAPSVGTGTVGSALSTFTVRVAEIAEIPPARSCERTVNACAPLATVVVSQLNVWVFGVASVHGPCQLSTASTRYEKDVTP